MKQKMKGTSERPRLYVFKSKKHIYAQIIDDSNQKILASSSSIASDLKGNFKNNSKANCMSSTVIGQNIAIKALKKGIDQIIFDRGHKKYHGKIKALADAVRKEGINF